MVGRAGEGGSYHGRGRTHAGGSGSAGHRGGARARARVRRAARGARLRGRHPWHARARPAEYGEGTTLTATAQTIAEAHGVAVCRTLGDLTDGAQVERVVAEVDAELGPIDILVHNAGGDIAAAGGRPDPNDAVGVQEADVRAVLERNLLSTILVCQRVAQGMIARRRGRILTISSIAAFHGRAHGVIYATAKAGVVHYTRCLAAQLRPYEVTVNSLAPGRHAHRPLPQYPAGRSDAPGRRRHARAHCHGGRGRAGRGVLRRPLGAFVGPGAARRRRRPMLAGLECRGACRLRPTALGLPLHRICHRRVRPSRPAIARLAEFFAGPLGAVVSGQVLWVDGRTQC